MISEVRRQVRGIRDILKIVKCKKQHKIGENFMCKRAQNARRNLQTDL